MAKSSTILSTNLPKEGRDQLLLSPQVLSEPRAIPTAWGVSQLRQTLGGTPGPQRWRNLTVNTFLNKKGKSEANPTCSSFVHSQKQSLDAMSYKFCPSSAQQCAFVHFSHIWLQVHKTSQTLFCFVSFSQRTPAAHLSPSFSCNNNSTESPSPALSPRERFVIFVFLLCVCYLLKKKKISFNLLICAEHYISKHPPPDHAKLEFISTK